MELVVFYSLAAVIVISALAVVLLRNVLHSALCLGLALAGVAGIFGSLGADFLFAAQILIYVSGVAVLVVFVVMLAGRASELHMVQTNKQWVGALSVCGLTLYFTRDVLMTYAGRRAPDAPALEPMTRELGHLLLSDFAVPFELISLILIISLIGAVFFTRPEAE